MPSEEGKQVLKLLADGKIDVDQAYRLLRALGDVGERAAPPPPPPPVPGPPGAAPWAGRGRGRILHVRVTSGGEHKVNIAVPLSIARLGKVAWRDPVRGYLSRFGIDLEDILGDIDARSGQIVDIADGADRVEIFVE